MVSILLATYNSSKHLKEQLDSLCNQKTSVDYNIYIRDDGSTDNTLEIIEDYVLNKTNILLIKDNCINLGAKKSFMKMLANITSEYYMFCDHDDIWLENKIDETYKEIKNQENNFDTKTPIIVHTDLTVIDQDRNVINNSFWNYSRISPIILGKKNNIQVLNCVTGCTMIFNNAAKLTSIPYPENIPMHDWWLAIATSKHGIIKHLNKPSVLYRQHNLNVVGARKINLLYFYKKLKSLRRTYQGNFEHYEFIKSINGVSIFFFFGFKIYYSIIRLKNHVLD